ncbi:MAG: InlB B-repeat-containing protein, partial [Clostridia bacterium]|nr:InlB B-repeat-containing protein [Clostridia bacterium]
MNTKRLIKATFVTLMVCATAGTLFACRDKDDDKEYKVVYLGGDGATGEAPATVNYKEGDKFTVANNTFTKENHTFNGWSDGTSTYGEGVEYTMGAADVTFTAQWKENTKPEPQPDKYTVTYALGDHASSMASVPGRVKDLESGATVKMPKAPAAADGYKFIGWQIGDDTNPDNYKQPGDEIPVTKSITVTAQWASLQTRYTVTYALGDHAHADAKVPAAATELLEGATVTLPDAPKAADGYEFTGWKIGDGANAEIKKKGTFTVTGSVTVTAQWAEEGTAVKPEYITDSEIKDQIKPLWDPTKTYFVGDGEDVTIQATITAGTVLAHTGILTDMNINDDWYRFRPDAQVFGFKPWNTWDPASESNAIPAELSIDATNWDFAKYQGLFADGASCIQVVNISLEDNVVTVTVTNYAGMDTELATPVTSAKYTVTLKADTAEIKPNFFYDGGAVITAASAKAPKASNTYVNLTFDFDTDGVENAVVPMRPGKDNYKFGTDPTKPGYTFTGWKSSDETDTKLYKDTDEVAVTAAVTYTAQWTQDEYTVTYAIGENAVEGAEAPNGYTGKHYGDKINLPAEADTPAAAEGYEFKGWKVGT